MSLGTQAHISNRRMDTFGHTFRLTTFGESHGLAVGGIIDGCPSGIAIDTEQIRQDLQRRGGPRNEPDEVIFLSGIVEGKTIGTSIGFMVKNVDAQSEDYEQLQQLFRPGHADYTYEQRYGTRDWRGGGRSSARETVARVVAGSIAKQILAFSNIKISTATVASDNVPDGDTIGGIVNCTITGAKAGIGNPLFGKLNATLAGAMMSIPSAIGFEMGAGFGAANMKGSEYIDNWSIGDGGKQITTTTNHCGGIQGGISNGMPIEFRVAFHPVVTLQQGIDCIDAEGNLHHVKPGGRHDNCQTQRAAVIVESMAAIVLADYIIDL